MNRVGKEVLLTFRSYTTAQPCRLSAVVVLGKSENKPRGAKEPVEPGTLYRAEEALALMLTCQWRKED